MRSAERNAHGSSTRSKQHAVFGGAPFPRFSVWAKGARVECDDGRNYCDWIAGLGAIGLGYQYPGVQEAVYQQLSYPAHMVTGPLPHWREEDTAAALCEALQWPEQVRWVNSGSEATEGAMRIARRATGRTLILSVGYHGHHQAHQPGLQLFALPKDSPPPIADYRAAAVILECGRDEHPMPSYFDLWRRWCDDSGALLILDEVWAGFRVAIGGCTEKYGARPDLACFSKALGNGFPVAAITGPRALMQYAHDVSSTFGGNGIAMAAARAVIDVYQREPVIKRLNEIGERLLAECPTVLTGVPARPRFRDASRAIEFVQALAKAGHLTHPAGITPTYSHSDADVESLIQAIKRLEAR